MTPTEHPVLDAIFARRSIRRYLDRPVEREKIRKLLEAAMAAPSACNIQPWEFVVIDEVEAVRRFKGVVPENGPYNAPLVIVVCGLAELIPWGGDNGIVDCCAAIENMLIAATEMGLGSVWIGGFQAPLIRKELNIPEKVSVIGIAYFGYPDEEKEPRTQYLEDAVYWQIYDPQREHHKRSGSLA
jgi:nitroreductase